MVAKCGFCGARPTGIYSKSGQGVPVCIACLEEQTLEDALDSAARDVLKYVADGDFDATIGRVRALLANATGGPRDARLRREVREREALILQRAGRPEEALAIYTSIVDESRDPRDVLMNIVSVAFMLKEMGRAEEASAYCLRGLDAADEAPRNRAEVVALFACLARVFPIVPIRYRSLLCGVARGYGVSIRADLIENPISLSGAVAVLEAHVRPPE